MEIDTVLSQMWLRCVIFSGLIACYLGKVVHGLGAVTACYIKYLGGKKRKQIYIWNNWSLPLAKWILRGLSTEDSLRMRMGGELCVGLCAETLLNKQKKKTDTKPQSGQESPFGTTVFTILHWLPQTLIDGHCCRPPFCHEDVFADLTLRQTSIWPA